MKSIQYFYPIWFSQTISVVGSELTKFAIPLWLLTTGVSATTFSLVAAITILPRTFFGLFIGPVIDFGNKKQILIFSEIGQATSILLLYLIYKNGFNQFQFLSVLFAHSTFSLFNYPTMSALVPQMVIAQDLKKANSLMGITDSVSMLMSPILGGIFVFYNKIDFIFLLDIISFTLNIIIIGKIVPTFTKNNHIKTNIWLGLKEGFYFFQREATLAKFLIISIATNFSLSLSFYLSPALLLIISGDERIVGTIQTLGGISQLFALWLIGFNFRPKQLAKSELIGTAIFALIGPMVIALAPINLFIYAGYVIALLILPLLNVWNRTLWQTKVPKEMLGRVFATKRFISSFLSPIIIFLSGIMIDKVLINQFHYNKLNSYKILFFTTGIFLLIFSFFALNSGWIKKLDAKEL